MATLKCPNPSCPYVFDPSGVPPGAVLACPRCNMRFTLGPTAPPPTHAPQMPQGGAAYAPTATFAPGQAVSGTGLSAPSAGDPPSTSRGRSIARKPVGPGRQGKQSYQMILIVGIAVILVVGAGITIFFRLTSSPKKNEGNNYVKGMNLSFGNPPSPWQEDPDAKARFSGNNIYLVFKRSEPDAYIVFGGRDYAERMPRKSELEQGINKVINSLFETVNIEKELTGVTWLGITPTHAYQFRGQDRKTGDVVQGEAFSAGNKGIGYWSIAWTVESSMPAVQPEFEAIRKLFFFSDPNKVWQAKKSTIKPIVGDKVAFSLQDPDDVWKEDRTRLAVDEDALADTKLVASVKSSGGGDFRHDAELVVYAIAQMGEPIDDAKGYLESALKKDLPNDIKVELTQIEEEPLGAPSPNAIDKNTEAVRLQAKIGNLKKLIVISAVKVDDKVVFARCTCNWSDREIFEQNFIATCGSLKAGR